MHIFAVIIHFELCIGTSAKERERECVCGERVMCKMKSGVCAISNVTGFYKKKWRRLLLLAMHLELQIQSLFFVVVVVERVRVRSRRAK